MGFVEAYLALILSLPQTSYVICSQFEAQFRHSSMEDKNSDLVGLGEISESM